MPKGKKQPKPKQAKQRQVSFKKTKTNRPVIRAPRGFLSTLGGIAGTAASSFLPGAVKFLGPAISRIIGSGDYKMNGPDVSSNSLMNGTTPPQFSSRSDRSVVVAHREYIQDISTGPTLVNGATAFNSNTFNINPGQAATFPWLSNLALNFEEYEILGMVWEFKSMSANALNSTNTALGTVILSTDYNVLNQPFNTKMAQENYDFAQSVKPSESCIHAVECARKQNPISDLYVRTGAVPAGADQRLYDFGQFQISTAGMQQANVVIGELWQSFHIALRKPRLPLANPDLLNDQYNLAAVTSAAPLGTTTAPSSSQVGTTISGTGTVLNFPATVGSGFYSIVLRVTGNGASVPALFAATTGCGILSQQRGNGSAAGAYITETVLLVQVTQPSATLLISGATNTAFASGTLNVSAASANVVY